MRQNIKINSQLDALKVKEVEKPEKTNDTKDGSNKPKRVTKIGRNEKCPCGSGKKYKQCCGK